MAISLHQIPPIGNLEAEERRELARWLRTPLPRGEALDRNTLEAALAASPWGDEVTLERLVSLGWVEYEDRAFHGDTYARKVAAEAAGGAMTVAQSHRALQAVVARIDQSGGTLEGVRLLRVLALGDALRDGAPGDTRDEVHSMELALEFEISWPALRKRLANLSQEERWLRALELSGWEPVLRQNDVTLSIAGSAAHTLQHCWQQLDGAQRVPTVLTLWARPGTRVPPCELPAAGPRVPLDDMDALQPWARDVLGYLEARTLRENLRARQLQAAMN